jgi:predicted transcriptional regulator
LADILEIAKEGTLKTQIMNKAHLSFTQLNDYLKFTLNNDLINQTNIEGSEVYVITEKGLDFLQKHSELTKLLKTCSKGNKDKIPPKTPSKKTSIYYRNFQAPTEVH